MYSNIIIHSISCEKNLHILVPSLSEMQTHCSFLFASPNSILNAEIAACFMCVCVQLCNARLLD